MTVLSNVITVPVGNAITPPIAGEPKFDELTQYLTIGEMDKVLSILEELNDLKTLHHLQTPLSTAFKREITAIDMHALKGLLWKWEEAASRASHRPVLDSNGYLKATLKLIRLLHLDGAWNCKVKGLDHSGKESERWLVQGFLNMDDVYRQLKVNQWAARFSMSFPGALTLTRRLEDAQGQVVCADTTVDVDGVVFLRYLDQSDRHNVPPTIKDSDTLDKINRETEHRYWKYNLASVTHK